MEQLIFHCFDEYAGAVQHANIRVTLASRQQTHWALDYLPLGSISVQWGQDAGPNVVEGSSSEGGLSLFIPRQNANSIAGNGCAMEDDSVMVLVPGKEFCMAAASSNQWSSLHIPFDQLEAAGIPADEIGMNHNVLMPTEASRRLRLLIEDLGTASRRMADTPWSALAVNVASRKIVEAVLKVFGIHNHNATPAGRHSLPRQQIAQSALRKLEEHAYEPISVSMLSSMIGISERTLRTAFVEYFGVGPTRYVKVRALHQARALLKASDPDKSSVTEIAVSLGIWELGRFSHDYKALFNELPSQTLRNG